MSLKGNVCYLIFKMQPLKEFSRAAVTIKYKYKIASSYEILGMEL